MKRFSDEDWKRILAGDDFLALNYHAYLYNDEYNNFIHQLMEKVDAGYDISKVKNLKEIMKDIIYYMRLDEIFLEKYEKFLDWNMVSKYQILSEEFIEKYEDKWDWNKICSYQTLSEKFIRKHFNDFNESCWAEIASRRKNNLSEEFIREFSDLLQMDFIGECQAISKNFLREFADKISYGNWDHNMRKHETMTQEETLEFTAGYYDKNQIGLTVAEVAQGINYDYSPY